MNIDISQGIVAKLLRCGDYFIANTLLSLPVKELRKSINLWWNFEATNLGDLLSDHPVDTELIVADTGSRDMTASRETVIYDVPSHDVE